MKQVATDVSDQGVEEYIEDMLGSLALMAGKAGLRILARDIEELRQRHAGGPEASGRACLIAGRPYDA